MSVRIQLDNRPDHYTNLDIISGHVILTCPTEETVTAVVVKLEGESISQLLRPPMSYGGRRDNRGRDRGRDRDQVLRENHKVLYKVAQVFPENNASGLDNAVLGVGMNFTLPPGQHVWPFRFKIPINNGCANFEAYSLGAGYGFGSLRLAELPQQAYRHTTTTLPPTLPGFPNVAESEASLRRVHVYSNAYSSSQSDTL